MKRIRGGLVFKAHGLLYHSTLGLIVIKTIKKVRGCRLKVEKDGFPTGSTKSMWQLLMLVRGCRLKVAKDAVLYLDGRALAPHQTIHGAGS